MCRKETSSCFTWISKAKPQFFPNWFVKIRFTRLPFVTFWINFLRILLILLVYVEAIILVAVEVNVIALNNRFPLKNIF